MSVQWRVDALLLTFSVVLCHSRPPEQPTSTSSQPGFSHDVPREGRGEEAALSDSRRVWYPFGAVYILSPPGDFRYLARRLLCEALF